MTRPQSSRLVLAVVLAVSIHAAAATGLLLDRSAPPPATDPGDGGAMLLIASTAAGSSAAPETSTENPTQVQPEEPAPEKMPNQPEPPPKPDAVQPQKPVQRISIEKQPALKPVVQARRTPKVPLPDPRPVPVPKRKPVLEKQAVQERPAKIPAPPTPNRPQNPPKPTLSETQTSSLVATSGDNGRSDRTQIANSSGGRKTEHGAYLAAVRDWLHEHKRYPRRARLRMMRGEAVIGFVLDRSGRVVSYELRRSTGHAVLDREVIAMIRRASPMPSFPPDMTKERMDFSVPVQFDIN